MGKKKHRKKRGEVSLLSFVGVPSAADSEKKDERGGKERKVGGPDEVGGEILKFISGGGKVSKSELWSWVKKRGLSPASFYQALTNLLREGAVKRVFDEDLEEYVFYVDA